MMISAASSPTFFQNFVNTFFKQIVRVRTFLWILFAVHDRMIHALEYLLRIDFFILIPYDWLEEAGRIAGMTCRTYLIDFASRVSLSQSMVRDLTY